jgi:hypothetical protein
MSDEEDYGGLSSSFAEACRLADLRAHEGIRRPNDPPPKPNGAHGPIPRAEWVRLGEVPMEPVQWLWLNRLARGKVAMLCGDSALGKSQISCGFMAALTKSGVWPDGTTAPLGSVILLSAEDGIADTVRPRAESAGADTNRVHVLQRVHVEGKPKSFSIQANCDLLSAKARELGDVALVIVDPVTAYLGGDMDSHRTTEVRAAMLPLQDFAEQQRVAILGIIHPPKAPGLKAINYIAGSGAFAHGPRFLALIIEDPELPGRNLMLPYKNSLGPLPPGIGYGIVSAFVPTPKGDILTSRIEWDSRPVTMTANEALAKTAENEKPTATGKAEEFLRGKMVSGQEYPAGEIFEEAEKAGIASRTLKRASKDMGVKKTKSMKTPGQGGGGGWWWKIDE